MANVAELIVKISADTRGAQQGLTDTSSRAQKMGAGLQKAALPAAAALAAVGVAAVKAGNAAAEDAQQQAILANTLKKTTGANSDAVASVEEHIAAMSKATGVADDELRPAMGNLLRATKDTAKSQEGLAAALDIAASTGASVESVSKAIAKGYGGSTGALKKLVPSLDEATLASGDMSKIMAEVAEVTGGAAAKSADTAAGKMKIMQNSMAEAEEEIGSALLPAMSTLADILAVVAGWIQKNSTLFLVIVGIIATLATTVLLANAAIKIYNAYTIIAGIVSRTAWLSALGPIALVGLAIMAVVGIIVLLWKKSETFRNIVLGVWGAIKTAASATGAFIARVFTALWDGIRNGAQRVWSFISTVWNGIRNAAGSAIDWIRNAWGNVVEFMRDRIQTVRDRFADVFDRLRSIVSSVGEALAKPFNIMRDAVDRVIDAIGDLISWIGKIKVPKIDIPFVGGGRAAPSSAAFVVPRVGGFAAPGVPAARATSSSSAGGVTINVTGALDPEATARQIRRLLAGHGTRIGATA